MPAINSRALPAQAGFTLIEVIIYMALFSILITGVVMSLYAVTSSADARKEAAARADEAQFVEAKLAYQVSQTGSLSSVALDTATHAITLRGTPLTSAYVTVESLVIVPIKKSDGTTSAYDVSFSMSGEVFSNRFYLP